MRLYSVYEEDLEHGQHYVRFRIEPRVKVWALVLAGSLLALLVALATTPPLWPLMLPVAGLLWLLAQSRRMMVAAAAQLAEEAGSPLRMIRVEA